MDISLENVHAKPCHHQWSNQRIARETRDASNAWYYRAVVRIFEHRAPNSSSEREKCAKCFNKGANPRRGTNFTCEMDGSLHLWTIVIVHSHINNHGVDGATAKGQTPSIPGTCTSGEGSSCLPSRWPPRRLSVFPQVFNSLAVNLSSHQKHAREPTSA